MRTLCVAIIAVALLAGSAVGVVGQYNETAGPELVPTDEPAVFSVVFEPHEEWMGEPRQLVFGPDGTIWVWDGSEVWQAGVLGSHPTSPPFSEVHDLAVALDGRLWVADRTGLYSLDGATWGRHWAGAAFELVVAPDGTLQGVGGGMRGKPQVDGFHLLVADERGVSRRQIEGLPATDWPSGIAATPDGGLWVGALSPGWGFVGVALGDGLLLRSDGGTWEMMRPLGEDIVAGVTGLAVGPDGSLWTLLRTSTAPDETEPHLARFTGQDWIVYSTEDGLPPDVGLRVGSLAVDTHGDIWSILGAEDEPRGVAGFDGQTWTRYQEDTLISDLAIGPDGSIWTTGSEGIHVIRPEAAG